MPDRARAAGAPRDMWVLPDDGIIDPVAVEIAVTGKRPVRLTTAERRAAAARILAGGGTPWLLARRLRMSQAAARVLAASIAETGEDARP